MDFITFDSSIKRVYLIGSMEGNFRDVLSSIKGICKVNDEDMAAFESKAETEYKQNLLQNYKKLKSEMGFRRLSESEMKVIHRYEYNNKRKTRTTYGNSLLFFTGNCGIGLKNEEYHRRIFDTLNKVLGYNKVHAVFLRGNLDNPAFFDGKSFNYSNIKLLSDYSVLNVLGKNILCIGGGVTPDRTWKKEVTAHRPEGKARKDSYFENEPTTFNAAELDKAMAGATTIDMVVSHSAPTFVGPQELEGINTWLKKDPKLSDDIFSDRMALDKVFNTLRENKKFISSWAYSHFDYEDYEKRSNVEFFALLRNFQPKDITQILTGNDSVKGIDFDTFIKAKNISIIQEAPRPTRRYIDLAERLEDDEEEPFDIPEDIPQAPQADVRIERGPDITYRYLGDGNYVRNYHAQEVNYTLDHNDFEDLTRRIHDRLANEVTGVQAN